MARKKTRYSVLVENRKKELVAINIGIESKQKAMRWINANAAAGGGAVAYLTKDVLIEAGNRFMRGEGFIPCGDFKVGKVITSSKPPYRYFVGLV